jgi:uncharacterized membrane protein YuzA (DUF378 family)
LALKFLGRHGYVGAYTASGILFVLTGISVAYDILTFAWFKKKLKKSKKAQKR